MIENTSEAQNFPGGHLLIMIYILLVLSHMFGYLRSKNYWADCEKVWIFLNVIFMSVRISSFNAIHSVIKTLFHKGPLPNYGACQNWCILSLYIFQRNLAHL
jgi:hypothetical protein